jgi:hypothetical protein
MNINMTNALELAEYARSAAIELLDDATTSIMHDNHLHYENLPDSPILYARAISADQLESAAFANSFLDSLFDDFMPMMLIFELICQYIMNITSCSYDDICADY